MKVLIDRNKCIGSATCISLAPEVFEPDERGVCRVVNPAGTDDETLYEVARRCPSQAVTLRDANGVRVYPPSDPAPTGVVYDPGAWWRLLR